PTPTPTVTPTVTPTPTPTVTPTTTPTTGAGCTATYKLVNQWDGGFQAEVAVQAGSAAIGGWKVQWTFPNGQSITQLWNGTLSSSGSAITVTNLSWNGNLAANATTSFGFLANGSGGNSAPSSITCAAS
ncbi:MAG TPA: cellulose binding domain-containing protein, partial [Thermopolyspora sp.]